MDTTILEGQGLGSEEGSLQLISVIVSNEEERKFVHDLLQQIPNNDIKDYSGVVTGYANQAIADEISKHNLVCDYAPQQRSQLETTGSPDVKEPSIAQLKFIDAGRGDTESGDSLERGSLESVSPTAGSTLQSCLLTFNRPLSYEVRQRLAEENIELLESKGNNSFLALLTPEQYDNIADENFVTVTVTEPPKVSEQYADQWVRGTQLESFASEDAESAETYDIDLYKESDLENTVEAIKQFEQVEILERSGKTIRAKVPENIVPLIRNIPLVRFITRYSPPTLYCNSPANLLARMTKIKQFNVPWDGTGEIVGVLDSGIDKTHKDLAEVVIKETPLAGSFPQDQVGHGTHVAGIIAGNGTKVRGVAPGARLINVSMVNAQGELILPPDYTTLLGPAVKERAFILNLSWGRPIGGNYNEGSFKVDEFAYNNPEVLIVVAAGNSGIAMDGMHGFGNIGAPASAKNILTVGSAKTSCELPNCPQKDLTLKLSKYAAKFPKPPACDEKLCAPPITTAGTSSRGPTEADGIKPEVLAPGMFIESTKGSRISPLLFDLNCITQGEEYIVCSGTSMAAPFVSGCAAIVRQYLKATFNAPRYSASLLKALLIASADPIDQDKERQKTIGYPDFDQGYGLIDLLNILPHDKAPAKRKVLFDDIFNNSGRAMASLMPTNNPIKSLREYAVNIAENAGPVKVVLCWTDPPGNHVQNNLQLDVIGPDNLGIPGNAEHLYQKNSLTNRFNRNGKPFDKINTTEAVTIQNPQPGRHRIRIFAENTPMPNQGYALVFVGETDDKKLEELGIR